MRRMRILAGDIGGTNTRLSIYERTGDAPYRVVRAARYPSGNYDGLTAIVREFCADDPVNIDRAAFGVAGPVIEDRCKATNLPWEIDARRLEIDLSIPRVRLVNDFHAVALGIPELDPAGVVLLQDGAFDPEGTIAIVGAGTGLGEAIMLPGHAWRGRALPATGQPARERDVIASEGGHVDFAPRNEEEIGLLRFLLRRHARVSVERVVSGRGIGAIYDYVVEAGLAATTDAVRERLAAGEDPGGVIGEAALSGVDEACVRAIDLFVAAYGAEAGNLALKVLPSGGVYVAGGVAPRLLPKLKEGRFLEAFRAKGRMSPLLETMRVAVITDDDVGLLGARAAAEHTL